VISFITNLKGEQEYDTNTQRVWYSVPG
jgi:hypothetical protein